MHLKLLIETQPTLHAKCHHDTLMTSPDIALSDNDRRLPYLYWTPKLHKSPVKHCLIAENSCPAC